MIPQTKPCPRCREIKPIADFNHDRSAKDGLRYRCKACDEAVRQLRLQKIAQQSEGLDPSRTQECTICHQTKPLTEFYKQRDCLLGVKSQCKPCYVARNNKKRERPGYVHHTYPGYIHEWMMRNKYGITVAEHDDMFARQNGVCAICGLPEVGLGRGGKVRRMSVDHNHVTGTVRALLCHSCNFIIGGAKEDPEILRKAADYLEKYNR